MSADVPALLRRDWQRPPGDAYAASRDRREEQIQCYTLRLTGMSLDKITKEAGLSKGIVHNRIRAEIQERVLPLADEVRQLDRLDR